jgi:hypothetical protein
MRASRDLMERLSVGLAPFGDDVLSGGKKRGPRVVATGVLCVDLANDVVEVA